MIVCKQLTRQQECVTRRQQPSVMEIRLVMNNWINCKICQPPTPSGPLMNVGWSTYGMSAGPCELHTASASVQRVNTVFTLG